MGRNSTYQTKIRKRTNSPNLNVNETNHSWVGTNNHLPIPNTKYDKHTNNNKEISTKHQLKQQCGQTTN